MSPPCSPIPHSLYDPATNAGSEICLFTKDPPAPEVDPVVSGIPTVNPVKAALQAKPVAGITKILSLEKLRKNYHQFGDRRRLLAGYSLFLTDERIMPRLPALLGAKFYEKKKQPVAVNLAMHDFTKELVKARDSTYMYLSTGATLTVRISKSSFSRADTAANILAALPHIAAHVPRKWKGIQSIHIKSTNSIALPIYNSAASIEPLLADPEPVKKTKATAANSNKKTNSNKKASSTKKAAATATTSSTKKAGDSTKKPTKGQKRPLATKQEEAAKPTDAGKTSNKKAKVEKEAPAAAPAAVAAKPSAAAPKPTQAKRQREAESPAAAESNGAASPAPSAKKQKKTEAAAVTPTKVKAAPVAAKSAVKAEATPAKAASTKKAPSTVASKKK